MNAKATVLMAMALMMGAAHADPAGDIVNRLKAAGLPVGKVVVYTEDNDPNNQLGRPNSYVAKASWADKRHKQPKEDMVGGTVEVFKKADDLERRKRYVEAVTKELPMFNQYIYVKGLALMRLPNEIKPSQAREYEAVFMK